jgi:hypothetical protein
MEAIHRMIGNAVEHFPKIEFRVQTGQLGAGSKNKSRLPLSSLIRAGNEIIPFFLSRRHVGSICGRVIDLDPAVVAVAA